MKILVIFTGGTIGSMLSDGWIAPSDASKYLLINQFREQCSTDVDFDYLSPYTVLSENLSAKELNRLINCINENMNKDYDGIIVTHGTDTLQYSAAAVSFSAGMKCIPIVFVSSNYPLNDSRANGLYNFIAAVEFIKSKCGSGVFISYKNREEPVYIHRATRVITHAEMSDEVFSVGGEAFAFYKNGEIQKNESYHPSCNTPYKTVGAFSQNTEILVLNAVPGDGFYYDLSCFKAVILRPYHSGTLNTESDAFKRFCLTAHSKNIPVFLCNASQGETYESAQIYEELGIIQLPLSPFPAVFMKLWALKDDVNARSMMKNCIADEYLNNYQI